MTKSEQRRADALADAETLRATLQRTRTYLSTIEHTLLSVAVPSGQPGISRAFVDIHSLIKHATAEIDTAFRAAPGLRPTSGP